MEPFYKVANVRSEVKDQWNFHVRRDDCGSQVRQHSIFTMCKVLNAIYMNTSLQVQHLSFPASQCCNMNDKGPYKNDAAYLCLWCVCTGTGNIREGWECQKNGRVQHSYSRLQKFTKHAQGFVNCSRELFLVRHEFQKSLKFLANVSSIQRTIDDASEPPHMFGKLLEP